MKRDKLRLLHSTARGVSVSRYRGPFRLKIADIRPRKRKRKEVCVSVVGMGCACRCRCHRADGGQTLSFGTQWKAEQEGQGGDAGWGRRKFDAVWRRKSLSVGSAATPPKTPKGPHCQNQPPQFGGLVCCQCRCLELPQRTHTTQGTLFHFHTSHIGGAENVQLRMGQTAPAIVMLRHAPHVPVHGLRPNCDKFRSTEPMSCGRASVSSVTSFTTYSYVCSQYAHRNLSSAATLWAYSSFYSYATLTT